MDERKAEKLLLNDEEFQPTEKTYFKIVKRYGFVSGFYKFDIAEFDKKTNKPLYETPDLYCVDPETADVIMETM